MPDKKDSRSKPSEILKSEFEKFRLIHLRTEFREMHPSEQKIFDKGFKMCWMIMRREKYVRPSRRTTTKKEI